MYVEEQSLNLCSFVWFCPEIGYFWSIMKAVERSEQWRYMLSIHKLSTVL